jgi:hypothetical protein
MDYVTYCSRLTRRGFRCLGEGSYGRVYHKPKAKRVIKVGRSMEDAWLLYAEWAVKNPGKHVLRVFSLKYHKDFWVAVLEKLTKTVSETKTDGPLVSTLKEIADEWANPWSKAHLCQQAGLMSFQHVLLRLKKGLGPKVHWDLHGYNIMFRGYGKRRVPVIIDPVFGRHGLKSRPAVKKGTLSYKEAA